MPASQITSEKQAARTLLTALDSRRPTRPVSEYDPQLDLTAAYRIAGEIRRLREERGERVVGRKIGFTNRSIWAEYGVDAPIWGYMYDTTLHELPGAEPFDTAGFLEPRIEPEIVFGLRGEPHAGMDETALLACIDWVAHGFEIVQSVFPGWRFRTADSAAAFGLHGALLIGLRHVIGPGQQTEWLDALQAFQIALSRDGIEVAIGCGADVLDGPMSALRHLVAVLEDEPSSPALSAGEIVSTGTLTRALAIEPGERWSTRLWGIPLPGIAVTLR